MAKSKKEKSTILDEYRKNTGQNRKYVIRKINSPFFSKPKKKRIRKRIYDGYAREALAYVWEIFDYPCGQRVEPLLKTQVDRLREFGEGSIIISVYFLKILTNKGRWLILS